jgi:hypothetical protein
MSELRQALIAQFQHRDPAFDPARSENFCLALQIAPEGIIVCVLDNLVNDFLVLEHFAFRKPIEEHTLAPQFVRFAEQHDWLLNGFKRIDIMLVTDAYTLVPSALFDSNQLATYLQFNHTLDERASLLTDHLQQPEARMVWAAPAMLEQEIRRLLPNARLHHHASPLIQRTLTVNKNLSGKKVIAHVHSGRFDLLICEGSNLLLCNTYRYQTSEDFLYYLLFACEQLKLNPESLELELVGEIEEASSLVGLAKKYIRNVKLGNRPVEARFAGAINQLPNHRFYTVFALHYYA